MGVKRKQHGAEFQGAHGDGGVVGGEDPGGVIG